MDIALRNSKWYVTLYIIFSVVIGSLRSLYVAELCLEMPMKHCVDDVNRPFTHSKVFVMDSALSHLIVHAVFCSFHYTWTLWGFTIWIYYHIWCRRILQYMCNEKYYIDLDACIYTRRKLVHCNHLLQLDHRVSWQENA